MLAILCQLGLSFFLRPDLEDSRKRMKIQTTLAMASLSLMAAVPMNEQPNSLSSAETDEGNLALPIIPSEIEFNTALVAKEMQSIEYKRQDNINYLRDQAAKRVEGIASLQLDEAKATADSRKRLAVALKKKTASFQLDEVKATESSRKRLEEYRRKKGNK
jgi:hypothetical protein